MNKTHHGRHHGMRDAMRRGGGWGFARDFGPEGEGFGQRGGRRRMFDGEELRLVLLALLEEQPRHGYDLIREIEKRTGGAYAPSPGVVYPTLTMLDELGHIDELKEDGARKRFAISDAGRALLAEKRAQVDALLARLSQLGERSARTERVPVKRAMVNLHMALRGVLGQEGAPDRAHEIAAILDEATRQIERLG
ncbi:PadR family transcriptional regulator [Sphingomonas nostoxanthinifaciens]|uniref:PadR family transcriptional regulator n=1 Tax=Sphingomonas nostoxanthinifaciens TaxID=2872652 RepID=UPI001CC1EBA5|nr:PadR family transcriptional regulator [Sphingomonas nostoxanthinifaciens]